MKNLLAVVILQCVSACLLMAGADSGLLSRRYTEGEKLTYRMTGWNDGWQYEIRADGVVKKVPSGGHMEEYVWRDLKSNGSAIALPPASSKFRLLVSLDPDKAPTIPKLAGLHPMLIGPITDFLTLYADLWLANRLGGLDAVGDRLYQRHGPPASWADGSRVVLGEDSIDFHLSLTEIDTATKAATLLVRHVPPKQPQLTLPAAWMQKPVADTPNNWVNVSRKGDTYAAAVGKEMLDVNISVSLADGKILRATIENPVKALERDCVDAALTNCGEARTTEILRRIEVSLER